MIIGDMATTGRILFVESWGFRWLTLATAASTILAIVAGTGVGGAGGNAGGGGGGQSQPSFATQPGPAAAAGGGQPYNFGQPSGPGAPAPLTLQNPTFSGGTVISGPPPEKKPAPAEGMSFGELGKGHN